MTAHDEDTLLQRIFDDDDINEEDVPDDLRERLYAIPTQATRKAPAVRRHMIGFGLAACLCLGLIVGVYEQHNRKAKAVEHAQQELAVALYYLQKTQQKAQPLVLENLNTPLQRATLQPLLEQREELSL